MVSSDNAHASLLFGGGRLDAPGFGQCGADVVGRQAVPRWPAPRCRRRPRARRCSASSQPSRPVDSERPARSPSLRAAAAVHVVFVGVAARGHHQAVAHEGVAVADQDGAEHADVGLGTSESSVVKTMCLAAAVGAFHDRHRRVGTAMAQEQALRLDDLARAPAALRVVQRDDEVGQRHRIQPARDGRPRRQAGRTARSRRSRASAARRRGPRSCSSAEAPGHDLHLRCRVVRGPAGLEQHLVGRARPCRTRRRRRTRSAPPSCRRARPPAR